MRTTHWSISATLPEQEAKAIPAVRTSDSAEIEECGRWPDSAQSVRRMVSSSPTSQFSASQIAVSVEKRIAVARSFFRMASTVDSSHYSRA